ncbi:MAG TPA: SWIM zinc finger family protein [Caldilineaceae bacterium]|nr:SWIM zinc finger family protein [Caldilineaceae bacterium]
MSYRYYNFFERTTPIQTDEGIKARSKRGDFAKNWWAARWIKALEPLLNAGRLTRGRSYARRGQVLEIKENANGISAKVQGSQRTPYKVTISLQHLSDKQWEKVIDALAERAIFTAQLLAGEMPQEIEEAFDAAGVTLFPGKRNELMTDCSCPDPANPCKHIAATHYILGEQFDEDPFLLFRLRGRDQDAILDALRAKRAATMPALAEETVAYVTEEPATPLAETLDRFWTMGESLAGFPLQIKAPVTALPILKRLGQPSFLEESVEQLLGPAYRAMTEKALALYDGAGTDHEEQF